jgi:hypothetical protein
MIEDHARRKDLYPVIVALAVAIFGVIAILLVDHGPWSGRHLQTAEIAKYKTTGEAARAAGAEVAPTEPKPPLEPEPQVPKQAEPPNPAPD